MTFHPIRRMKKILKAPFTHPKINSLNREIRSQQLTIQVLQQRHDALLNERFMK